MIVCVPLLTYAAMSVNTMWDVYYMVYGCIYTYRCSRRLVNVHDHGHRLAYVQALRSRAHVFICMSAPLASHLAQRIAAAAISFLICNFVPHGSNHGSNSCMNQGSCAVVYTEVGITCRIPRGVDPGSTRLTPRGAA
eukprot:jgi/Botrbrau1/2628/Bobra.145_1s0046.1